MKLRGKGLRTAVGAAAVVPFLLACGDPGPPATAESLFEIRPPVTLPSDEVEPLKAQLRDDLSGRLASASTLPGHLLVSELRNGRIRAATGTEGGAEVAVTPAHAGRLAGDMVPRDPGVDATPYWTSWAFRVAAVGSRGLYVATSLLYPIRVHDEAGVPRDSLGSPPPSWRQARRPEVGEFASQDRDEMNRYLESFTMIIGLAALGQDVLVVNHGRYVAGESRPHLEPTRLDVYVNSEPVLRDAPSPGEVLAYSRRSVFFVRRSSEEEGWTVVEYRWAGTP